MQLKHAEALEVIMQRVLRLHRGKMWWLSDAKMGILKWSVTTVMRIESIVSGFLKAKHISMLPVKVLAGKNTEQMGG